MNKDDLQEFIDGELSRLNHAELDADDDNNTIVRTGGKVFVIKIEEVVIQ